VSRTKPRVTRAAKPILYTAGTQRDNEAVREDLTTQAIKGGKGALPLFEYRAKPFLLLPLIALLPLENQETPLKTLSTAPFDPRAFAITLPIADLFMPYFNLEGHTSQNAQSGQLTKRPPVISTYW
jgi:hypothetical protein